MPSEGKLITKDCPHCGNAFHRSTRRSGNIRKYCSHACAMAAITQSGVRRGSQNGTWKGGQPFWICLYCGGKFRAYRTTNGRERKFCAWECSDKYHEKEHIGMRERVRYENELMQFLGERGYQCLRSAGSRGAVDVCAFDQQHARLIQVKSTKDLRRHGNTTVFKIAIKELLALAAPLACRKELWVRVLRQGWFYLTLENAPSEETALIEFIQNAEWVRPE